jgi:cell division protein ZapA
MANVSIKFNGKEFLLSCDDGQEEHLEELLIQLNKKFNELKNDLGNLGENKLLLITAVKVMDEYHETKKKIEQKKDELKELSNKFRELKSLVYDYRDKKQEEIKNLNEMHNILKIEIENNQKNYEKIIDQTTNEISNFIDKTNSEKLS